MFDYEKFVDTYSAKPDATRYSARFFVPDDRGVWCVMWSGPITQDGVIELLNQDAQGHVLIKDIRHW